MPPTQALAQWKVGYDAYALVDLTQTWHVCFMQLDRRNLRKVELEPWQVSASARAVDGGDKYWTTVWPPRAAAADGAEGDDDDDGVDEEEDGAPNGDEDSDEHLGVALIPQQFSSWSSSCSGPYHCSDFSCVP